MPHRFAEWHLCKVLGWNLRKPWWMMLSASGQHNHRSYQSFGRSRNYTIISALNKNLIIRARICQEALKPTTIIHKSRYYIFSTGVSGAMVLPNHFYTLGVTLLDDIMCCVFATDSLQLHLPTAWVLASSIFHTAPPFLCTPRSVAQAETASTVQLVQWSYVAWTDLLAGKHGSRMNDNFQWIAISHVVLPLADQVQKKDCLKAIPSILPMAQESSKVGFRMGNLATTSDSYCGKPRWLIALVLHNGWFLTIESPWPFKEAIKISHFKCDDVGCLGNAQIGSSDPGDPVVLPAAQHPLVFFPWRSPGIMETTATGIATTRSGNATVVHVGRWPTNTTTTMCATKPCRPTDLGIPWWYLTLVGDGIHSSVIGSWISNKWPRIANLVRHCYCGA